MRRKPVIPIEAGGPNPGTKTMIYPHARRADGDQPETQDTHRELAHAEWGSSGGALLPAATRERTLKTRLQALGPGGLFPLGPKPTSGGWIVHSLKLGPKQEGFSNVPASTSRRGV